MILLITSRDELRKELYHYLIDRKYAVCVPEHREDAMTLVQRHQPEVIVLDMDISEPNGLTFLRDFRASGCSGKVMVLSGVPNRTVTPGLHHYRVDQIVSGSLSTSSYLDQIESVIRGLFREEISKRAYSRYLQRGKKHGKDWEDWFRAEKEILKPSHRSEPSGAE